jgi:hypothetical protein
MQIVIGMMMTLTFVTQLGKPLLFHVSLWTSGNALEGIGHSFSSHNYIYTQTEH